jgi:hypothetical protein
MVFLMPIAALDDLINGITLIHMGEEGRMEC